jgi:Bacterial PH domain
MAAASGPPGSKGSSGQARRSQDQPGRAQTFRSPTALVVWVVWLLFAIANWIDLAVQGRDHLSVVAAAILLLVTGIAYDTAQRPRIIADDAGVTVRNPLRDHRISWAAISNVDLVDVLRVHVDWSAQVGAPPGSKEHSKVINSWAVHYSRRRMLAAEARARRASRSRRSAFGLPYGTAPSDAGASAEAEAKKIVRTLSERATAAQAEAVWAGGTAAIAGASPADATGRATEVTVGTLGILADTGALAPVRSTWNWPAIAAIVIPALILLVISLV